MKKAAWSAIDRSATALQSLSSKIWSKPELAYEEHEAHALLTSFLKEHGFQVDEHYTLDTAFRARAGANEGANIAVICEFDALPEIGHACGHNLIAEAGCAAGIGIKAALEASGAPLGRLTILGTPAEEGGGGKADMIKNGCFDDVDMAMMVHPSPLEIADPLMIALTQLTVTYSGKASHAAAFPWEGINALDAAVSAYNGISMLRQQLKPSWRVHGIITNGGAKPNIIPEKTEMQYYLRTPANAELDVLVQKARGVFHSAAQATGCCVQIDSSTPFANVVGNSELLKLYVNNSFDLGVEFSPNYVPGTGFIRDIPAGSTDMGNVSYIVPSIHPMYKIGTTASIHSREFAKATNTALAHERTLTASKAIAGCAIDVLTTPGLLQTIKDCFKQQVEES